MPFGFFEKNPVVGNKRIPGSSVVVLDKLMPPDVTLCVPLPSDKNASPTGKR